MGFWNDKFIINTNYYINRSSNQLLEYALPIMAGFDGITQNFPALVQNSGWEFSVNTKNVSKSNFTWTTNVNLTIPSNKLVKFPGLASSTYASRLVIGEPITILKVFQSSGVNAEAGTYEFIDNEGKLTSSPNTPIDRIVVINTAPVIYGGLQNSIAYGGVQLDFLFQFVKQTGNNGLLNSLSPGQFFGGTNFGNQSEYVLDRWQKPGDQAQIQKYTSTYSDVQTIHSNAYSSDMMYSDASFVRLKNLSISWQLPRKWLVPVSLKDLKVYAQGQNIITITNYRGLDPETMSFSSLPPLRVITLGVKIDL